MVTFSATKMTKEGCQLTCNNISPLPENQYKVHKIFLMFGSKGAKVSLTESFSTFAEASGVLALHLHFAFKIIKKRHFFSCAFCHFVCITAFLEEEKRNDTNTSFKAR